MKNKCVLFFLLSIISTLSVSQSNMTLADQPNINSDDSIDIERMRESIRQANPYRPFAATWPNSEGILLDIQMNTSTSSYVYSKDRVGDGYRHFRSFITATINHLASTLGGLNVDEKIGAGEREVKVIFVRKGLVASEYEQVVAVPSSLILEDKLTCRLESPWIRLDIQRSPVLRIHAVFFWRTTVSYRSSIAFRRLRD